MPFTLPPGGYIDPPPDVPDKEVCFDYYCKTCGELWDREKQRYRKLYKSEAMEDYHGWCKKCKNYRGFQIVFTYEDEIVD